MNATTVKVSPETRDRLRTFGGATMEDTINEALDALESAQFWKQAEAHAAWRRSLSPERLAEIDVRERDLDSITSRLR
jgi:predicted transcriptional regulator